MIGFRSHSMASPATPIRQTATSGQMARSKIPARVSFFVMGA